MNGKSEPTSEPVAAAGPERGCAVGGWPPAAGTVRADGPRAAAVHLKKSRRVCTMQFLMVVTCGGADRLRLYPSRFTRGDAMQRFVLRGRLALFWLLAVAAVPANSAERQTAERKTGRYRGDINDPASGDVIMRVAMQVPEKLPTEKHLGLILLFHGSRGNENNYIGLTVTALRRLGLLDQYVVISGKSKGPGWTNADDSPVLRIIKWAKETYPIDSRRVFVFGSSNGAAYVGRFGSAHQELIAGVVGYCGNYRFAPELKGRPAATRNEWYFVHGGKDRPQNSRRACDELKAAGYRYVFRQMDGYGHTDIWDSIGHPSSDNADAVRDDWLLWMQALRHREISPTAEEQKSLAGLRERLRSGMPRDLEPLLKEAERIGGEQAGAVVGEALASKDVMV